jgi:hypothetical protein
MLTVQRHCVAFVCLYSAHGLIIDANKPFNIDH